MVFANCHCNVSIILSLHGDVGVNIFVSIFMSMASGMCMYLSMLYVSSLVPFLRCTIYGSFEKGGINYILHSSGFAAAIF